MKKTLRLVGTLGLSGCILATAVLGVRMTGPWLIGAVAVPAIVVILVLGWWRQWRQTKQGFIADDKPCPKIDRPLRQKPVLPDSPVYDEDDPAYLSQQMLEQGRFALLLRPQIAESLNEEQLQAALGCLDEEMGIVPEGDVLLQSWRAVGVNQDREDQRDRLVRVDAIYLDRHPVTNEQYQKFVDDGGYENMSLWDATVWPAVLDFVDQTGHPGPRNWEEGRFPEGFEDHPVVGVSWHEGAAYARWAGKRLPSDPEWVKAGCWPVLTHRSRPLQRRYPWGDTMDREVAHLWGSGVEGTVSVYELSDGASVAGVYHLIGNVWEWTTSNFGVWDATTRKLETTTPLKSIRGGAFDTYFDTQATCQFQSGENPLARKHNIGFRCALAMCDVLPIEVEGVGDCQDALVACGAEIEEEVL